MLPGQNWNNITAKYFGKQRMRDKSKVKLLKCYYSKLTSFLSKLISVSIVVILVSLIPPYCGFSKTVFSREKVKHCFFVTFNIVRYIFPENFIKNPSSHLGDMKIFFVNINYFHHFFSFLTISCPCCK